MPMRVRYKTLTDLWHRAAAKQLFATHEEIDFVASIDTCMYDNLLSCDSMEYDFDMGRDLWLTKSRFTILQRDYLDLYQLQLFLDRCEQIGLGESKRGVVTQMFCKQHKMSEKKYRWGNCMMAFTFRGGTKYEKPTLVLHSRVSYIAYIGGLDLALAYVLAREIGQRIGLEPEDFQFRWSVDSLQFHGFKSLPYLFRLGYDDVIAPHGKGNDKYPDKDYPTLRLVRKWYGGIVDKYESDLPVDDEKYGPLKRIRRRHLEYMNNDYSHVPPVPIEELNFDPLRARG